MAAECRGRKGSPRSVNGTRQSDTPRCEWAATLLNTAFHFVIGRRGKAVPAKRFGGYPTPTPLSVNGPTTWGTTIKLLLIAEPDQRGRPSASALARRLRHKCLAFKQDTIRRTV